MDFNTSIGHLLINRSVGQFEKIKTDLEKGIEYCKKAISEKNSRIQQLNNEINEFNESIKQDQTTINKAEKFKTKIDDLLS